MLMIWLIIYLVGVIVSFFLAIYMERQINDITLEDTLAILLISSMSWITAFAVSVALALSYLDDNKSDIVLFKKKGNKKT